MSPNNNQEILLMVGSPRQGGNSAAAARIVFDELRAKGRNVKTLNLHDFRIEHCRGCLICQEGHNCPITDDFLSIWKQVKQAETMVYFIPVYWCSPPGLMKDFIDRTVIAFQSGEVMKNKSVHLVSLAQAAGFGPQEKIIDAWGRWLGGPPLKSALRLLAFHQGELLKNKAALSKLKKLAAGL